MSSRLPPGTCPRQDNSNGKSLPNVEGRPGSHTRGWAVDFTSQAHLHLHSQNEWGTPGPAYPKRCIASELLYPRGSLRRAAPHPGPPFRCLYLLACLLPLRKGSCPVHSHISCWEYPPRCPNKRLAGAPPPKMCGPPLRAHLEPSLSPHPPSVCVACAGPWAALRFKTIHAGPDAPHTCSRAHGLPERIQNAPPTNCVRGHGDWAMGSGPASGWEP